MPCEGRSVTQAFREIVAYEVSYLAEAVGWRRHLYEIESFSTVAGPVRRHSLFQGCCSFDKGEDVNKRDEQLMESVREAVQSGEVGRGMGRRHFLKSGLTTAAVSLIPLQFLSRGGIFPAAFAADSPYGPLSLVPDDVTGTSYLKLPPGFSYMSYGSVGSLMDDGIATPGQHDGMGVCRVEDDRIYLVRNHEVYPGASLGNGKTAPRAAYTGTGNNLESVYDSRAPGGATVIVFDALKERWESARAGIAGTLTNCAGGPTPWGTWLTCEEDTDSKSSGYNQNHGFVFEVRTDDTPSSRLPLKAMGRFKHEAAAVVDRPGTAQHGYVYLTEDNSSDPCGFYRFVPSVVGDLSAGGTLQMLKIKGISKANMSRQTAKRWEVEWVKVPEPTKTGVFGRGKTNGGAIFTKLEGAWYGKADHSLWFLS